MEDSLLWSVGVKSSFLRTCEFLSLCSKNGIVFNPAKFVFCEDVVDFAGYEIGLDYVNISCLVGFSILYKSPPIRTSFFASFVLGVLRIGKGNHAFFFSMSVNTFGLLAN